MEHVSHMTVCTHTICCDSGVSVQLILQHESHSVKWYLQ